MAQWPRLLAAPDKFRGSLSAAEAARAIADGVAAAGWRCQELPLSDGGEGFCDSVAPDGLVHELRVSGPLGERIWAAWRETSLDGKRRAIIESGTACGLVLAGGAEGNDPLAATTWGVGELVAAALAAGVDEVVVGCGGSASSDGGRGALECLGAFPPAPPGPLAGRRLVVACDVRTLFREAGRVFGPQKGASAEQVRLLDRRLADLAAQYARAGRDVAALEGSGAAGGLAGGLAALGGELCSGVDFVAAATGLDAALAAWRAVVTGEGSLDDSSLAGKVVAGVVARAASAQRPVLVVVGQAVGSARHELEAHGAEVEVLSERYGLERALAEPARLLGEVAARWVGGLGLAEA